jgi:hypothetical protein
MHSCDGRKQVRSERGNAALAWQMIADKAILPTLVRILFHEAFLSFLAARGSMRAN